MNETTIGVVITVILLGILVLVAHSLDRRSKRKGTILTGTKNQQQPWTRTRFYLTLLLTLIGVAVLIWGYFIHSWQIMVLGSIIFLGSIGFRYYWIARKLFSNSNTKGDKESKGTS